MDIRAGYFSSKNAQVNEINVCCSNILSGNEIIFSSADSTTEYLNYFMVSGMPPHILVLKRNIPLILLRNISPKNGFCNGTHLGSFRRKIWDMF